MRLIALNHGRKKGLIEKVVGRMGPTRGQPTVPPQVEESTMLDPLYVSVLDPKSSRTNDDIMCWDYGEEVAPTIGNDTAWLKEMDRALSRYVRWPKFVGMGTERNAFPFKKDLSLSNFYRFFSFLERVFPLFPIFLWISNPVFRRSFLVFSSFHLSKPVPCF